MTYYYEAFGLSIWAESLLPTLHKSQENSEPDLQIFTHRNPLPSEIRPWAKTRGAITEGPPGLLVSRRQADGGFNLRFADEIEFTISGDGSYIWSDALSDDSLIDASIYLGGIILSFVLYLRGVPTLHAGAIEIGGKAVIFAGHSGAGKSSITSALALRGCPALSDDTIALQESSGKITIPPAFPSIRLRRDSAAALLGSQHELPLITESWDKYDFALEEDTPSFVRRPLPPGAVYILTELENCSHGIDIVSLSQHEAVLRLSTLSHFVNLPDKELSRRRFEVISLLVEQVPVRLLPVMNDPSRIFDIGDAVLADVNL